MCSENLISKIIKASEDQIINHIMVLVDTASKDGIE